jgi:LmbE family N-acetylglucosaminyl deacetylase
MSDLVLRTVLVFAAHPDDPEFGCGGTVAKWTAEGHEVRYVICTGGDKGSWDPGMYPGEMVAIREREQVRAAETLGVVECIFLRHVDGELEPSLAFRRELALVLRQYRPHIVITHDPYLHYQIHPDHRAVGTAVMDAIAASRDVWYYPEQMFEGVGAHRVKELYLFRAQEPNFWVDITEAFSRKMDALRCHDSQVSRSVNLEERMRRMAEDAGREGGAGLAEAFRRIELP